MAKNRENAVTVTGVTVHRERNGLADEIAEMFAALSAPDCRGMRSFDASDLWAVDAAALEPDQVRARARRRKAYKAGKRRRAALREEARRELVRDRALTAARAVCSHGKHAESVAR